MTQAYFGYRPSLTGPFPTVESQVLPTTFQDSPRLSGEGAPESVVPGVPGQQYENLLNQDLYVKVAGNQKVGWLLVGKTTGGVQVFKGSGDPNAVITATAPALFYTDGGSVWLKTNAGSNNTGWNKLIAGTD